MTELWTPEEDEVVPAVIVTRHHAVAQFVRAARPDLFRHAPVLTGTVSERDVCGRLVAGNLPFRLAAACARFWAVEFDKPPRGQEYTLDEMLSAGAVLVEYRVEVAPPGFRIELTRNRLSRPASKGRVT
jgi:hypothetical protein